MTRLQLRALAMLATGAALATALPAFAILPVDQSELEVPIPTYPMGTYETSASRQASDQASVSLGRTYGGGWHVFSWNPQTQTPHYIIGTGADVAADLGSDFDAEQAARETAVENAGVLGLDPDALELVTVNRGLGKVAAHFQQMWNGYEVVGGRYHATFMETGRLFVMSSDFYSGIDLDPQPALSRSEAEEIAKSQVDFDPTEDSLRGETALVVLPVPTAIDQVRFHLVYRIEVETVNPIAVWVTHVDAHTGDVVWRYNDVHFFSGTTEANIQQDTYCNGESLDPIPYMDVTVSGQGTTTSDVNGNWAIGPNSGSATVTAQFYGPYCNVNRSSGQGTDSQFNGVADGGTPFTVLWNDANSRQDERDVFDGVSDTRTFIASMDPGFGYINARIVANVGVSGTCNAFWNGTINFYNAGGGCANTGEIQGVVHHEFGHGVQASILGSQGNEGLGEGNSDILANFITDESIIGRGFYLNNCTSGIRNADNNLQYPQDLGGGVHSDGRIIAGAVWDARLELEASLGQAAGKFRAGQLWHFGRVLERPFYQPDQVLSMFIADDNDGNLGNGTPNYDAICAGVTQHNFECPEILEGVIITHTPIQTPAAPGPIEIAADVETTIGGAEIDPTTVLLNYQINDETPQSVMMNDEGGQLFTYTIQVQEADEVSYFISAADDQGNEGTSPRLAPSEQYEFDVPTVWDDLEAPSGWTVNAEGTDNATTGIWVRVNPNGTSAQPEDDHTVAPGVIAWVTGNAAPGSGDGTEDIDNGSTTLYSPVYDVSGAERAKVKFWRWYSNDKGATPNTDTWVVQARNNGGAWVDIERNQSNQNAWVQIEADLIALFGNPENVQFKFIGSDLGEGSLVEAGVDDFALLFGGEDPADAPDLSGETARYAFFGARPNPISGHGSIAFQVPSRADVKVGVFDVAGRAIRTLAEGSYEAGVHSVEWDGRDDQGRELGSGVYYVRMQAGEYDATRSIVLQK